MIEKITFRDQVKDHLVDQMLKGNLSAGSNISLASMSRELDVSVTPIREALTQLQHARIIQSIPNRGFIIPELKAEEARNLYEVIIQLEILAIRNTIYNTGTLKKLEKINEKFSKNSSAIERINTDFNFHKTLTSSYKNPIANQILEDLKVRIFFYELQFMSDKKSHLKSVSQHEAIIKHLRENDIENVVNILQQNWIQILKNIE